MSYLRHRPRPTARQIHDLTVVASYPIVNFTVSYSAMPVPPRLGVERYKGVGMPLSSGEYLAKRWCSGTGPEPDQSREARTTGPRGSVRTVCIPIDADTRLSGMLRFGSELFQPRTHDDAQLPIHCTTISGPRGATWQRDWKRPGGSWSKSG